MNPTAAHLRTIVLHWTDLREAAGAPVQLAAFGIALKGHLARLDDAEQQEYNAHEAAHIRAQERDPLKLGDRPVPVRLHIIDTMRAVEAALARADLADPRRWRHTGRHAPDSPETCRTPSAAPSSCA
ncbi:hypothetical protein [Streptomyces sp. NPDC059639]|uniref:hypothetical protein n=1 Tax=Streptomyces sp. NPDC059639 TaxID=3346891 RepID=UPI0036BAB4CB